MRPSEARAGETREWIAKADEDLESCKAFIASGHFLRYPGSLYTPDADEAGKMFSIADKVFREVVKAD